MARKKRFRTEQPNTETPPETTEESDNTEATDISTDELALGNEVDTQPAVPMLDSNVEVEEVPANNVVMPDEIVSESTTIDMADLALSNETDTQPTPPVENFEAPLITEVNDMLTEDTVGDVPFIDLTAIENVTAADVVAVEPSTISTNGHTENAAAIATENTSSATPPIADVSTMPATETNSLSNQPYTPTIGAKTMASNTPNSYDDYQVMPESPWPPPIFVKRSITPQERYYIEHRWHSQWRFFDKKANDSKRLYFRLQRIVVIGSVTVPVLVSLDPDILAGILNAMVNLVNLLPIVAIPLATASVSSGIIDAVTVILSLAVAIAAGLESLNKYGDNWGSYRNAAEELQAEKSFYDVGGGRYANNPDAFARFVERTEEIIAQQHGRFVASVEKQVQETEKRTEEVLSKGKDNGEVITEVETTYQQTIG